MTDKTEVEVEEKVVSEVIENQGVEDVEPVKSPRQEIYEKYDKSKSAEKPEKEEKEEKPEKPEKPSLEEEKPQETPKMVMVKINGRERPVEQSKVDNAGGIAAYQKLYAAEEKLREAAETRRILEEQAGKLREQENRLKQREAALSQDAQKPTDPPEKLDGDQKKALADKAKAYREAVYDGEDEKADSIMMELLDLSRGNANSQEYLYEIEEKAASRALRAVQEQEQKRQRAQFENNRVLALNRFESEFQDIATDARLRGIADSYSADLYRENPSWSPEKNILTAAQMTREWLSEIQGDKGEDNSTREQKVAEKRSLSTPSSASGRKAQQKTGPKTQTNAEYIQELKRQRGLI